MLTSIEIENFKGIGARQRIDFAPLTLLFGANSAGKSTILQALLYLHELIEHGSADVDRTEFGGSVLELGGFARLVHRHESHREVVIRVEFETPGSIERFERGLFDFPFPDLDDQIDSTWLELTVGFRTTPNFRGPIVNRATIGVNKNTEPLVWLEMGASLREGEPLLARVNLGHPLLVEKAAEIRDDWEQAAVPEESVRRLLAAEGVGSVVMPGQLPDGSGFGDGRSLPAFLVLHTRLSSLPSYAEPLQVFPFGDEFINERWETTQHVRAFLEMVVLGTTAQLGAFLRKTLYIGPLRTLPPGGFLYERPGRVTHWADGLAAWDRLLLDRVDLVERTNASLRRLGAGCQVVIQQLFDRGADAEDLSVEHVDKTARRLLLDNGGGSLVLPSEVGAGVSQIIPVIVAALAGQSGVSIVEQPEIHVHPAMQVGLGDLFIDAGARDGQRRIVLVETHSEHLLLRVMRRMRETSEGKIPEGASPVRPGDVSVVLVEKDGSRTITRQMPLNERGELVKAWPGGFFEEGLREVF
jgi:hypothetical protein